MQIIPGDGFADGGTPYTDEELDFDRFARDVAASEPPRFYDLPGELDGPPEDDRDYSGDEAHGC